jgi:Protein of unknown function (DUF3667)
VSHSKERKEKDCLNCGAHITGRYCSVCGQENIEPKETVWGLVSHFFNDITHFDGKFFSTLKYLIVKPGFLSAEYIKGRRAGYLHPIRMYVFTSAFFFIIFFSLFNVGNLIGGKRNTDEQVKELNDASSNLKEELREEKDSVLKAALARSIASIDRHVLLLQQEAAIKKKKDSAALLSTKKRLDTLGVAIPAVKDLSREIAKDAAREDSSGHDTLRVSPHSNFTLQKYKYHSLMAYDSLQKELPESKKDTWLEEVIAHKAILFNNKWKNDKKEAASLFMEKFMHSLPQALFVSLPIFALLLLILYARRNFYYVDHGIFTIHLYCAIFILLLFYFAVDKIKLSVNWGWLSIIEVFIVLGMFFYLYKAMRKFYRQRRFKTIMKFSILLFFSLIVFSLLTALFFFLSFMQFA